MKQIYNSLLKKQIELHEGLRLKPYKCPAGKLTIGIGRNIDDNGITKDEAFYLLDNDLQECEKSCRDLNWYSELSDTRKCVIIELCFNIGFAGLKKFKKMIEAIERKDWTVAAYEMLDSEWAVQVGKRAQTMAEQFRKDLYEIKK